MLKIGETAPAFTGQATDGRTIRTDELKGRWLVVYFYPKAFTPGCTTETRLFRDNYPELKALGAEVIGVSVDDLQTQCKFADDNRVTFPLVADPDKRISRSFGVLWPIISIDKRITFVIDPAGIVRGVFRHEVQISKHLDDVLAFLKKQTRAA